MKNRITALALALALVLFGLPFTPVTTEAAYFQGSSYDLDDFARYGTSEEYIIVPCHAPNSCVDLNASNGTTLQIWQSAKVVNQIWTLESSGEYYYIKCKWNGKVVDVPGFNAAANQQLHCYDPNGGDNQLWRLESMGDGSYMIHSKLNDSLVWNVSGASSNNGQAVMLFGNTNETNEHFRFVRATSDGSAPAELDDLARYGTGEEYAIVPCNAGSSCVELNGRNGTTLQIYGSARKNNQLWTLEKSGNYYYIKCKWDGKVVDVPGYNAREEQQLNCYGRNGGDNQLWRLESMGDGTYMIHSKINDSLVWCVQHASWDDEKAIMLFRTTGDPNERFRFVHPSTVESMSDWGSSRQDCDGTDWSVWDNGCSYDWYYDHRNERDLYISNASELFGLTSLVANGYEMLSKTIHLTRDINLAGITWTPIGYYGHTFRGSFNGHNHTITGLFRTEYTDYNGLFGKVSGGTICNLAVRGTIAGDDHVGGIVGQLYYGHLCNIYSEVSINNCTDVMEGGICGEVCRGGLVDHCTQNAPVRSTDYDAYRGGIVGYSNGLIRYCVNKADITHNWDYGGGIVGRVNDGKVEFCVNHGTVSGGGRADYIGGIAGGSTGGSVVIGCYNYGTVFINDNDYVGGICGWANDDWRVICCINDGRVYGDDYVGGICGEGRPIKCLNVGVVTGDEYVGAIGGNARLDTPWCYALAYSAANLSGQYGSRAEWVTANEIISGRICYELNLDDVTRDFYGITAPLSQNLGSDPMPTFGSAKVSRNGSYINSEFHVTAECDRGYGSIKGAGIYRQGEKVTLTAKPAAGCVFDHFEVKTADDTHDWTGWNGSNYYYPTVLVKTYNSDTITLTDRIDKSYTVRAVFKIFDETPPDMRVTVNVELECTDDVDGWNNDTIPVEIIDSAGSKHYWSVNRNNLNKEGAKVSREFYLGTTSPVAVYVYPDFGGGLTFHGYGLKARIWVNGQGNAMESREVTINSYPFTSSVYNDDYMHISFENYGNSTVGGSSFTRCTDAWDRAKSDSSHKVYLTSAWLLDRPLELSGGQNVTLDLNGYPVIRTIKKTRDNGELFRVAEGATLTVIDSTPSRKSCGNFTGGSIQGGRSDNTGGLIECKGKLEMKGGTLYNGGTTDKGGAIKLTGSATADLTGVLISNCWSDKAVTYQNDGGAIYMRDNAKVTLKDCSIRNCRAVDYGGAIYMETDGNRLSCENVDIFYCGTSEDDGGGVYQDYGETNWVGGSISSCSADTSGGGYYVNNGKVYIEDVRFEGNSASKNGGAFYSDAKGGAWFIGCSFLRNSVKGIGGAFYMDNDNVYMEDTSVVSNTAGKEAGGAYLASPSTIGIAGKVIFRSNDGTGSMDNLVLEKNVYLYNHGLEPGSEVHLRSDSNGSVKMGGSLMSEYQLNQYFRADYGRLELTEEVTVNTELRASVFSDGKKALIIGAAVLVIVLTGGVIYYRKKQKGGAQ